MGERKRSGRVLASSFIGTVIEGFDFYNYTVGAAAVFGVLFFPPGDPALATIAALATLGVGYIVRPFGGIVYGYFGDRLGRKKMLVSSILLMGFATGLVGLMPTYSQIGILAPILLVVLRFIQGFAVAGEWGGSVLMALEHSAPNRRGFASSLVGASGLSTGMLLSSGCFALLALLPQEDFLNWGWRIPFLSAFVLISVGLWIRLGVTESPSFVREQERLAAAGIAPQHRPVPLKTLMRTQGWRVLNAFLVGLGPYTVTAVKTAFLVSYAILMGIDRSSALLGMTIGAAGSVVACIFGGWMSDIVGRRPMFIIGGLLTAVSCVGALQMTSTGDPKLYIIGVLLVTTADGLMMGPVAAFMSELFPTRTRFTGISIAYQATSAIGGGIGPVLAASLLAVAGGADTRYVAIFMVVCCLLTVIVGFLSRETYKVDIDAVHMDHETVAR